MVIWFWTNSDSENNNSSEVESDKDSADGNYDNNNLLISIINFQKVMIYHIIFNYY